MKTHLIYPSIVILVGLTSFSALYYQKRQETALPLYNLDTQSAAWHQLDPGRPLTQHHTTRFKHLQSLEIPLTATQSSVQNETASLTAVILVSRHDPPLTVTVPTKDLGTRGHLRIDLAGQNLPQNSPLSLSLVVDQPTAYGYFTKADDSLVYKAHYEGIASVTDATPFIWPQELSRFFTRLNHLTLNHSLPLIPLAALMFLLATLLALATLVQTTTQKLALLLLALAYFCF